MLGINSKREPVRGEYANDQRTYAQGVFRAVE